MAMAKVLPQANGHGGPLVKSKPKIQMRRKTKGACRTCKVRKVKCDEGRPCCNRCQSTGRICEGYGIWGGGDADSHYTARQETWDVYRCIGLSSSLANSSPDEKLYFDWFRSRTRVKLPGVFGSGFWEVLVMQVTHSESAALNAILAVACAHKRLPRLANSGSPSVRTTPDKQERFMLQHYSQAICDVQKYFIHDRASVRVVLIVCMLFVILEFLRGRTRSGVRHLQYGMKVITDFEYRAMDSHIPLEASQAWDSFDRWLLGAFSRLNLQALLFGQVCAYPRAPWQALLVQPVRDKFDSIPHAKDTLDDLQTRIMELTEQSVRKDSVSPCNIYCSEMEQLQRSLQSGLDIWHRALQASKESLHDHYGFLAPIAYQTLLTRYTAAKIMAARCLDYGNESAYDRHTEEFRNIIVESIKTYHFCFSTAFAKTRYAERHRQDVAPFVVDGAWIWPLYYTALKCRVRRLRLQALKLLRTTYSMEAVCDTISATVIAQEVINIEEDGLYDNTLFAANFTFDDEPSLDELMPPALSGSARVFDIQVTLPNLPEEMIHLRCKRKTGDSGYEVLAREYDSISKRWINKTTQKDQCIE